jgi:hypothetical protein
MNKLLALSFSVFLGCLAASRGVEARAIEIPSVPGLLGVAAGSHQTCAWTADQVKCWGDPKGGTPPARFKGIKQVYIGNDHQCVLDEDGLWCWGDGFYGETDVPPGLDNALNVSLNEDRSCAVDGREGLVCWGKSLELPEGLAGVREIGLGEYYVCALDETGVKCRGNEVYGATHVPPGLKNPRLLAAGDYTACVLDDDGVKCWSNEDNAEARVPTDLKNPTEVKVGIDFACALDDRGVRCWGAQHDGLDVPAALKSPRHLTVGIRHACAQDGLTFKWHCWGRSSDGELRLPRAPKNPRTIVAGADFFCTPDDYGLTCWGEERHWEKLTVPAEVRDARSLSLGVNHACSIEGEKVVCWDKYFTPPAPIALPREVVAHYDYYGGACALGSQGLTCWGGAKKFETTVPSLRHPRGLTLGSNAACAFDDGELKCWGDPEDPVLSQLPKDLIAPQEALLRFKYGCALDLGQVRCWGELPFRADKIPSGLKNPRMLRVSARQACVVDDDGVRCWDSGAQFSLPYRPMPAPLQDVKELAVTDYNACALLQSGRIECWGWGDARLLDPARDFEDWTRK